MSAPLINTSNTGRIMEARFFAAVVTPILLLSPTAHAAELKLLASASFKTSYVELLPQFENATGNKVTTVYSGTPDIQRRLMGGEAADVVILGSSGFEELIKQGKLRADSRANFGRSGVAVAVRAGAPRPDIGSAGAVRESVLKAKSISYSDGASGVYLVRMFQRLGIADNVKEKLIKGTAEKPVGEVVARGEAEIGFHQLSELLPTKGIDIIGPLPPELQEITVFSGGIPSAATDLDGATALIKFLTAPSAVTVLKKHGLEPG